MKKYFLLFILMGFSFVSAQTYSSGWAIGLGFTSPRMFGDVASEQMNLGGNILIQHDFDEYTSVRGRTSYLMFTSNLSGTRQLVKAANNPVVLTTSPSTDAISSGIDFLYTFNPCSPLRVYAGIGGSILYFTVKDAVPVPGSVPSKSYLGEIAINFIAGGRVSLDTDLELIGELGMHQVSTDKFDGFVNANGGLFGGMLDSYLSASVGLNYYVDRGTKTKICEDGSGLSSSTSTTVQASNIVKGVDYGKIEELIKKYAQPGTDVDYNKIEDIVKKNAVSVSAGAESRITNAASSKSNWVLIGINFDAGKFSFRPESYPILINAAQVLLMNPSVKIQIEGHTDNVGSAAANQKLSETRAEAVKKFLVAKGVDESRISTVGYGASNPSSDNKSTEGKAFNRRIEFKVIN